MSASNNSSVSSIEEAKRRAAYAAVDEFVVGGREPVRVGVGSGSTIVYAVERLAQRVKGPEQLQLVCVPTSFQATQLILDHGLPITDLARFPNPIKC